MKDIRNVITVIQKMDIAMKTEEIIKEALIKLR